MRISDKKFRSLLRWAHIATGAILAAFVYSPLRENDGFVLLVQFGLIPALILTGVWMSQQARVRRLLGRARTGPGVRTRSDIHHARYDAGAER